MGSVAQESLERCNGITKELPFSISYWSGALWAQAELTKHSPPGPSSASERLSRAGSRDRVLMVEKLQKKQGGGFLSTHTATQPIPSTGSRGKQLPAQPPARSRHPQHPAEGTDLRVPLSARPPWVHLYLSAAPVTDPPHPNTRDYKSRQPPRPRQTPAAGGAPRCTLGLVVLPLSPQEPRRSGVPGAPECAAAEAAVPGSGREPTSFSARRCPGSSLFSSHVRQSPVDSPPSAHRAAAAAPGGHLGCGGASPREGQSCERRDRAGSAPRWLGFDEKRGLKLRGSTGEGAVCHCHSGRVVAGER